MEYREDDKMASAILKRMEEANIKPREGIHLSDLDLCLKKAYYRRTAPIPPSEQQLMMFYIGWAVQHESLGWEEEELELDGIKMSVDTKFEDTFVEFKTTRQSINNFKLEEHVAWVQRIGGYTYAKQVNHCYLAVLFLNGNYKPPFPQLKAFRLDFTDEWQTDNWRLILRKKEVLEEALEKKEVPEVDFHLDWECKNCENYIPGRCWKGE